MAYSGGGDSLAALLSVKAWADRRGRPVIGLHVDHGLQAVSGEWARSARAIAEGLGLGCHVLPWRGDKPRGGLPAAARQARHALLAEAARTIGAKVIVLGHTADDGLEAELMRAQGSSLGTLATWRPSPVWPEGRGLFILRPLLGERRAALRLWLAGRGQPWIEDPANDDPRYARARARQRLAMGGGVTAASEDASEPTMDLALATLARRARTHAAGHVQIDRALLTQAPPRAARRFVSAALTCVGGGDRPPRADRLSALIARLSGAEPIVATLAGAKIIAGEEVLIVREAGAFRRSGAPRQTIAANQPLIWDGRFLLEAPAAGGLSVGPLAGAASKLSPRARKALTALPPDARGSLPLIWDQGGAATCPMLDANSAIWAKSLVADRLLGVCGVISKESEI